MTFLNTIKKYGIEILMSLIGIIFIALGLAIFVKAAIGLDPWGVLFNGSLNAYKTLLPKQLHIFQYGDMITLVSTLFVFIASYMKKESIKWLSIISGVVLGQCVNLWVALLGAPLQTNIFNPTSYILLILGIVALAVGSVVSLSFPILLSPVDYLILAIKDKFPKVKYGPVRIGADTSAVILGTIITLVFTQQMNLVLVNVGTVIMFFGIGFAINLLLPLITPYLKKIKTYIR